MKAYLALLVLPLIAAAQIDSVYYDADNEAGSEYVLLANTGTQAIDLTEWTLATPTSETDATLAGTIHPGGTYLVADAGWDEHKDDPAWPDADHQETLTLPNTAGYAQLTDPDGVVHSTVGWGDAERSEGTPHPGTDPGDALVRTNDTQDNSNDFTSAQPQFTRTSDASSSALNITLADTQPRIIDISVPDDDPAPGIDVLPTPGEERSLTITVLVEAILFYTVWKYRKSDAPKPTRENRRLEITWTVATAIILLFVGVASYGVLANPDVTHPADAPVAPEDDDDPRNQCRCSNGTRPRWSSPSARPAAGYRVPGPPAATGQASMSWKISRRARWHGSPSG